MLPGIDISNHQGRFPIAEAAQKGLIQYVWAKCSEGNTYKDPFYHGNAQMTLNEGLPFGAYHYAHPSQNSPLDEFNNFKDNYGDRAYSYIALDLEEDETFPDLVKWVAEWMDLVQRHYHVLPVLYTNRSFLNRMKGTGIAQYPIWLADPSGKEFPHDDDWTILFWQHDWHGNICGREPIDLDSFNGTILDLIANQGLAMANYLGQ